MTTRRIARTLPDRRLGADAVMQPLLGGDWRDERSMRALEILVSAAALGGASMAILAQAPDDRAAGLVDVVVAAAVMLVASLLALLRRVA